MAVDSTLGGDLTTVGQVVRKAQLQTALDELQTQIDNIEVGGGAVDSVNGQTGVVVLDPDDLNDSATTNKFTTAADISKLSGIESNATADQSDAEIETAYNNQVGVVSQGDAEAGTSTTAERWTPQRVKQAIDALSSGASLYTNDTIYYVDPVGGNDSNNGLTAGNAKATIQAAVDALDTAISSSGEGVINLLPGRHDAGDGVDVAQDVTIHWKGPFWNRRVVNSSHDDKPNAVVYSSSTSPSYLIRRGIPGSESGNADGGVYEQIMFEMHGENMEFAVHNFNLNRGMVTRCTCWHTQVATYPNTYFINHLTQPDYAGADGSWLYMVDNLTNGTGLVKVHFGSGTFANTNEHRIERNIVFGHSSRTVPNISLARTIGCSVWGNTVEGGSIGISMGGPDGDFGRSHFIGNNSGEGIATHIDINNQTNCTILAGGQRDLVGNQGTWKLVDFDANSYHNIVLTGGTGSNSYNNSSTTITDAQGTANIVIGARGYTKWDQGDLPTADPSVAGRWYANSNVITQSAG